MKSGVFRESRVAHGGSGRVSGRCLPCDVSAESFEETDTARNSRIRKEHGQLTSDVGVSS